MSTPSAVDLAHELQARLVNAASGIRDPEEMRMACEEMDRLRKEIHARIGVVEVAVDLIREVRE